MVENILEETHGIDKDFCFVCELVACTQIRDGDLPPPFLLLPLSVIDTVPQLDKRHQAEFVTCSLKVLKNFRTTSVVLRPNVWIPRVLVDDAGDVACDATAFIED